MFTFGVKEEGFEELGDRLDKGGVESRLSINEGLREIGRMMVPILKNHTPTGVSNKLRTTTVFQIITGGLEQRLEIRQGAKSGAGFFYGQVVRGGRRAGAKMPPPEALIPWVQKKMGIPARLAPMVAFALAVKIGKRGIKPNPYHVRALRAAQGKIQQIVHQMGTRVTAYLAGR